MNKSQPHINVTEIWRAIPGYEESYQVSNMGRIKSLSRVRKIRSGGSRVVREKILILSKSGSYPSVNLSSPIGSKTFRVHVLVATAFVQNHKKLPIVNHKDGNKSNCVSGNLEWTDHDGNTKHAVKNGLVSHGTRVHGAKLNPKKSKSNKKKVCCW